MGIAKDLWTAWQDRLADAASAIDAARRLDATADAAAVDKAWRLVLDKHEAARAAHDEYNRHAAALARGTATD